MSIIQTIFAFIISLGILVSIHEWGHFWVARKMGVKVLRFSIGFGKSLFTWHDKRGTEFSLSMIPLGGYVKMLDEREGDVPIDQIHLAFNQKSVWARIAIVAAGPVANFILAIAALWLMYLIGLKTVVPTIGQVIPDSPAAHAGISPNTQLISLAGQKIHTWNDANLTLAGKIGDTDPFTLRARSSKGVQTYQVTIKHWPEDLGTQSLLATLGIETWFPTIPSVIGRLVPNLPAEKAGLKTNDHIVSINGTSISSWTDMVKEISNHANMPLDITVLRNNQPLSLTVTPESKTLENDNIIGFIGAEAKPVHWPQDQIQTLSYNPLSAFTAALSETWKLSAITAQSLYKMVTGILSLNNLSGPITIAKVASASMHSGIESFLYFIAMLSVSLGVINLLPIPVLDGGHLLYYFLEAVRGRPLSEKIQNFGLRVGIAIVLCVMLLALYNDFSRL